MWKSDSYKLKIKLGAWVFKTVIAMAIITLLWIVWQLYTDSTSKDFHEISVHVYVLNRNSLWLPNALHHINMAKTNTIFTKNDIDFSISSSLLLEFSVNKEMKLTPSSRHCHHSDSRCLPSAFLKSITVHYKIMAAGSTITPPTKICHSIRRRLRWGLSDATMLCQRDC